MLLSAMAYARGAGVVVIALSAVRLWQRTAPRAETSGAAKRRAAKLAAEAAAAPPNLHDLILLALPTFTKGRTFYHSMLRVKVQQEDPAKTLKRKFGDKDEWRLLLRQLQDAGTLSYDEDRDEIIVPADA